MHLFPRHRSPCTLPRRLNTSAGMLGCSDVDAILKYFQVHTAVISARNCNIPSSSMSRMNNNFLSELVEHMRVWMVGLEIGLEISNQ